MGEERDGGPDRIEVPCARRGGLERLTYTLTLIEGVQRDRRMVGRE